ncbi:adenosylcobinamide-GDP ribazoletransferase, partial [Phycicoccus elongatus]
MNAAWGGLRLAVGTLTMIPVGHIPPPTRRVGAWSMALAPVAALPLGVLVAATCLLGRWLALPALVTASLSIGALALATRALHLDGLA